MPEAPDLHVLREYLAPRVSGREITSVRELRPLVVRNLAGSSLGEHAAGRVIEELVRKGKLLIMSLSGGMSMVVSPMLTGELSLADPGKRMLKSTILTINLGDGAQIRYTDAKRMGQIYYLESDSLGRDHARRRSRAGRARRTALSPRFHSVTETVSWRSERRTDTWATGRRDRQRVR